MFLYPLFSKICCPTSFASLISITLFPGLPLSRGRITKQWQHFDAVMGQFKVSSYTPKCQISSLALPFLSLCVRSSLCISSMQRRWRECVLPRAGNGGQIFGSERRLCSCFVCVCVSRNATQSAPLCCVSALSASPEVIRWRFPQLRSQPAAHVTQNNHVDLSLPNIWTVWAQRVQTFRDRGVCKMSDKADVMNPLVTR